VLSSPYKSQNLEAVVLLHDKIVEILFIDNAPVVLNDNGIKIEFFPDKERPDGNAFGEFLLFSVNDDKHFLGPFSDTRAFRDDFVKSPDTALRCILRHCGVPKSTPHSSGLARLVCELFTKSSEI